MPAFSQPVAKFVLKIGVRELLQPPGEVEGRMPPPAAPLEAPPQLTQEISSTLRQDASGILGWTPLFCRESFAPKTTSRLCTAPKSIWRRCFEPALKAVLALRALAVNLSKSAAAGVKATQP